MSDDKLDKPPLLHRERNVELTRRLAVAYNARDPEAIIAYFDQSIELHSAFASVGGAVYHGLDELPRYFRDLTDVGR
jgi:hypothetical protein